MGLKNSAHIAGRASFTSDIPILVSVIMNNSQQMTGGHPPAGGPPPISHTEEVGKPQNVSSKVRKANQPKKLEDEEKNKTSAKEPWSK
jgi:hypothetical protein